MYHRNAPLCFEGRLRLVQRCQQRPISHVAAEIGISRACASKWVNRWRRHGELGLHDRPSTPHHSPDATPAWVIERIETWRREKKWSANRITHELAELDFRINRRTVTRHLTRLGLGQRRFIDPSGHSNRKPGKIIARWPGHMAHLDVKKVGRIPDGGGWCIHGRNSAQKRAVDRAKTAGVKAGYLYLGKGVEPQNLLDAIRSVAAGDSLLSPTATRALIARVLAEPNIALARTPAALADLTPREREILTLVASGLSNDHIAERLVISPATAKTHVNRTMMKLNARDRAQLVVIAYETGLITPGRKPD